MCIRDRVQFLSQDGDSPLIHLWRERPEVSSAPGAEQPPPTATPLDAALVTLFEQNGLGALCADVCLELGVNTCGDLALVAKEDLNTLPKYVKDKLKFVQRRKLEQLIDSQLQFRRDLDKGDAASHLAKLVLLGDQTAGKSSLADSLALGRPARRAARDRTVGIDVRRWPVGGGSPLVVNVYDAAGHRVYRATHGLFMSPGALFLHVVRSDAPAEAAAAALLEWVGAVQQLSLIHI